MKKTLYATRAIAEESVNLEYDNYTLRQISTNIDDFDDDDSLCYLGSRSGECSGYDVIGANGDLLAVVAWWEEGGNYQIRKNGEVVDTATYWSLAQHIMEKLAEQEEDKELDNDNYVAAEIDCVTCDGETISMEDL